MTWVTVVIPCFNSGEDLRSSINSVLQQTYSKIELIVQDNKSTDPTTVSILKEYQNQCAIVVEKDNGIFDAFQKGIEKSKGEWIYLMGADDQLAAENVIEKLMRYDFGNQYDIMLGNVQNIVSVSHWIPTTFKSSFHWKIYWRNTVHQQGCLYRKKIFQTHILNNSFKILSDYYLHLQLYRGKYKALDTPLTFAVCKANGLSKKFTWNLYREEMKIKLSLMPFPLNMMAASLSLVKFALKKCFPRTIE